MRRTGGWRAWRVPGGLAAISAGGLLAGLLGDGAWDWLGSLAVLLPLLVAWGAGRRADPAATRQDAGGGRYPPGCGG